jgi:hypothetical protein
MILVCAFHFWYVCDCYLHEEAILTAWDIKHENFGWMLCWGNLVWVPFTYTIQAYYLVEHTHDLPWWGAIGIVLLNTIGYIIFRGANIQKHKFRSNPDRMIWGKPPEFICSSTANGVTMTCARDVTAGTGIFIALRCRTASFRGSIDDPPPACGRAAGQG